MNEQKKLNPQTNLLKPSFLIMSSLIENYR